jgi:hypothetical protein
VDLGFEIELTGFETAEIDVILEEHGAGAGEEPGPDDAIPEAMLIAFDDLKDELSRRRARRRFRVMAPESQQACRAAPHSI